MRNEPKELLAALEAITETYVAYAKACLNAGASGIFFAVTKLASRDVMTEQQYARFGTPYDLRVLSAVQDRPGFNILHICTDNIFFDSLMGYPADALSWDATLGGNPKLGEGRKRSGKMVIGGVSQQKTMESGTPEDVAREVARGIKETGGRCYAVGPGCTFPTTAPSEMLEAALQERDKAGAK